MRADTGRLRVVAHDVAEAAALDESLLDEDGVFVDRAQRDDDLPSPGAYIEAQRLRRGMSVEQLAVATKIPASSIALLEADRFEELPGQVFVKGFFRCCTRSLGVSQQAVMDLLHERERAMIHARRNDKTGERPALRGENQSTPDRLSGPTHERSVLRSPWRRSGRVEAGRPSTSLSSPSRPPHVRAGGQAAAVGPSTVERLGALVPSAHALLWIVVAIFVAFLVVAAFNLAGAPVGAVQS
ncbi:MAG: helix-turn-helix domain-containing protein [Nannocystaceae bacterium]|nr:helix-turn-helix domain-containing protein [Nannocystaceae bacterium]